MSMIDKVLDTLQAEHDRTYIYPARLAELRSALLLHADTADEELELEALFNEAVCIVASDYYRKGWQDIIMLRKLIG